MLTKEQLQNKIANGLRFLDGATGSNLQKAGMPKGCCTEQWVLENPEILQNLQRLRQWCFHWDCGRRSATSLDLGDR